MLNFLLDITPDKSQLLITIKLAGILREKKQEVYYTYTSNPAFTPVLYNKGISNCVLYPDDFRWLKPDLTLLDCRHAAHASLYRQLAIDYIFIAMQLPDQKNIQDKDISILYLPPTPYLSSDSGPRLETLTKRLQDIKKDKERNIIVGLLGKGNKNSKILEDFYRVIKRSSIRNPRYQFISLPAHCYKILQRKRNGHTYINRMVQNKWKAYLGRNETRGYIFRHESRNMFAKHSSINTKKTSHHPFHSQ